MNEKTCNVFFKDEVDNRTKVICVFDANASDEDMIEVISTYLEENEKLQAFISDSDLLFFGGHGNPTRESFEAFEMVKGVKEIHFVNREILILSDIDCDAVDTFIDTGYKRYILE